MKTRTIVFIVGPTAIGKTRLAVALARKARGEVVSADSMQLYKGMVVISQAPGARERKLARHHLIGYLDPREECNVASFRAKALGAIRSILKRKRIPIVAGGSGLYVKALVDGLFPSPEADAAFRKKMRAYAARYGSPMLHQKLTRIDPASAGKIHPNDARRIIRSLEIHHATGRTMTELAAQTKGLKDEYEVLLFGLNRPRHELYAAIDSRVGHMLRDGAVNEVKRLSKKKLSKTSSAVLGYKEIRGYLDGEYDLEAAKVLLQMNTRRFAKRQLSWFRADKRIRWFDVSRMSEKRLVEAMRRDVASKERKCGLKPGRAPWKKRS